MFVLNILSSDPECQCYLTTTPKRNPSLNNCWCLHHVSWFQKYHQSSTIVSRPSHATSLSPPPFFNLLFSPHLPNLSVCYCVLSSTKASKCINRDSQTMKVFMIPQACGSLWSVGYKPKLVAVDKVNLSTLYMSITKHSFNYPWILWNHSSEATRRFFVYLHLTFHSQIPSKYSVIIYDKLVDLISAWTLSPQLNYCILSIL